MKDGISNLDSRSCPASRGGNSRAVFRLISKFNPGLLCAVAFFALARLQVEAQVSREYQIKAVFLYNFAQFTEWPESAFPSEKSPIVIGIVGPSPFGSALEETVRGETVQGHPLAIEHYARAPDIKTCHILFVPQQEVRQTDEIVKSLKGKPVLTVADTDGAASAGAIVRFVVENNKVHFRINAEAARAANISLSSKLLRVAEATPGGGPTP